jgi:hypothetical protein
MNDPAKIKILREKYRRLTNSIRTNQNIPRSEEHKYIDYISDIAEETFFLSQEEKAIVFDAGNPDYEMDLNDG